MLTKLNSIAKCTVIVGTSFVVASGVALSSAVCTIVSATLTLPINIARGTKILTNVATQHIQQNIKD